MRNRKIVPMSRSLPSEQTFPITKSLCHKKITILYYVQEIHNKKKIIEPFHYGKSLIILL